MQGEATKPDVTPRDCAEQRTHLKRYVENGHVKIEFEAEHDAMQCQICRLCIKHCVGHYQLLDGLATRLVPMSFVSIKRALSAPVPMVQTLRFPLGIAVRKAA